MNSTGNSQVRRLYGYVAIYTLLCIFCVVPARAQRYDNIALGPKGQPIAGASVAVCTQPAVTTTTPCSPLATLYTNASLNVVAPNPTTTDGLGNYHFYINGTSTPFTVQIYGPSITTPFVMPDQSIASAGVPISSLSLNTIRYVTSSGNDSNSGLTVGQAKATWDAACEALPGGGIVMGAHFCGNGTIYIDHQVAACSNAGFGVQVLGNTATAFYPISSTCWENQINQGQINTICMAGIVPAFSGAGKQACTITGGGTADNWHPGLWLPGADGMEFDGIAFAGQGVNIITGYCPDQTIATSGNGCGTANIFMNGLSARPNQAAANGPSWLFGAQGLFIHVYNYSITGNPSATGGVTADAAQPILVQQGSGGSGDVIFQAGHLQDGGIKIHGGAGAAVTIRDVNNDNDSFGDTPGEVWMVDGIGPVTVDNASAPSDCGNPTATSCATVINNTGTAMSVVNSTGGMFGLINSAGSVPALTSSIANIYGNVTPTYTRTQTDDAAREFPAIIAPYSSLLATNLNSLTVCGTCTRTTGITDPTVVGTRAIQISDSGSGDNITMTATGDGGAVNGDTFLAGLWIKPATAGNCCSAGTAGLMTFFLNASGDHCSQTGTQSVSATPRTTDSLWEHYVIRCDISAYPTSGAPTLQVSVGSSQTMQYAFPELILLHGYTSSEIADIALHMGSWTSDCLAGTICTVGAPSLLLQDESGAQNSYARVLMGDGRGGSPGQVGFGAQSTGNDLAGATFLLNISPGTGDVLSASGFPNIDLGVLPSGKVGVHTLDTGSTTPACYGSQTMNTVSLSTEASCTGVPIIENCGATSGSTQACAKTVPTSPIVVFGDVTLNTATSQAITTLPFTAAADYSCSGSDLTTAAGTVSFPTYTSGAQVTIQETNGANTDHLRYLCVGF